MKRFLITTALAVAALTASAQDNYKFTIKAGAGLASVVGADADSNFNSPSASPWASGYRGQGPINR